MRIRKFVFHCVCFLLIVFAGCGLLFLNSCNNNQKGSKETDKNTNDSSSTKLENKKHEAIYSLNLISDVSDVFDGIGLYIAYDSINLENNKYLFIASHFGDAVIKIDNKNIYLKEDTTLTPVRINDSIRERWLGKGIQIDIFMNVIKDEEEVVYMKGVLQISSRDQKKKINVYGMSAV